MPRVREAWAAKAKQDAFTSAADTEDEEVAAPSSSSTKPKAPLIKELKAAKQRLVRARENGKPDEEFNAMYAVAEVQMARGNYAKALQYANLAEGCSAKTDPGDTGNAVRLATQARLAMEDTQEALKNALSEHEFHSLSGHKKAEAILGLALAEVYLSMKRTQEALKMVHASVASFRSINDDLGVASALQMLASLNLELTGALFTKRSLEAAEEALKTYRKLGDRTAEVHVLIALAKAHLARHEHMDAYAFAHGALELARRQNSYKLEAVALRELAVVFVAREDFDIAIDAAKDSVEITQHLHDWLGEVASLRSLANAYQGDDMPNAALERLDSALKIARELKDRRRIIDILEHITKIHAREDGLDVMEEELKLARSSGDIRRELSAYRKIGALKVSLGKDHEALETAMDALAVMRAAGYKEGEALSTQLVAEVYMAQRKTAEALKASKEARSLMQQAGDVKGEIQLLQMMVTICDAKGDSKEALSCCVEQRTVYKKAGWKEDEARTLLCVADVLLSKRGPWEAMNAAREAVDLFKELKDKEGEANAMLSLATFQVPSEAMRTSRTARQIFQSLGHSSGEAQALQATGSIHLHNGAHEEALQVTKEGLEICQKAGDRPGEAHVVQALSQVHLSLVQREVDLDNAPSDKSMQDALWVTMQSVALWEELNDMENLTQSFLLLSQLHRLNKDGQAALNAAKAALDVASKLDDMLVEGRTLLALGESYIVDCQGKEALLMAEDAKMFFEQLDHNEGVVEAESLVEACHELIKNPKKKDEDAKKDANEGDATATLAAKPRKTPAEIAARNRPQQKPVGRSSGAAPRTRGFSSIVETFETVRAEEEAAEKRRMDLLSLPADTWSERNQARARPSMAMAMANESSEALKAGAIEEEPKPKARTRPSLAMAMAKESSEAVKGATSADSLKHVLQTVRPDWSARERSVVQDKLASIDITSSKQLFDVLRGSEGTATLNARLKQKGFKALASATLEALKEHGEKLESSDTYY